MNDKEKLQLLILSGYPLLLFIILFFLNINYLFSILLFFGVPCLYLSILNKKYVKKTAIFALFFGIPMAFWVDFIMSYTKSWVVTHSIFDPFRIFGFIVIENIIWAVLYIYFIVIFYEVFFDKHITTESYTSRFKYSILLYVVLVTITTIIYYSFPSILNIKFFYFKFAFILGFIPVLYMLISYSKLRLKFLKTALYFCYVSLLYEFTALRLQLWSFPASNQYLAVVNVFGYIFLLEELFFWIILGALVFLSYYEFFDDDRK